MGRYGSEEETPGLRVLSAEPHLIVGCVDARRIDLDHDTKVTAASELKKNRWGENHARNRICTRNKRIRVDFQK
jgi:hypothetical protein